MKKIVYLIIATLIVVACKNDPKDYVTFSGKITNANSDSLVVVNPQLGYKKVINVSEDGSFKDTLKIPDSKLLLFDGKERISLFLDNGDDVNLTYDGKSVNESITFSGTGAEENNFLAKLGQIQTTIMEDNSLFTSSNEDFTKKMDDFSSKVNALFENNKGMDSAFVTEQNQFIDQFKGMVNNYYNKKQELNKALAKGTPSPKFTNYENFAGGETSLDDLKGKYVYIDLWATWCGPCIAEIPYLKKLEKDYHDKNITFVSISIDEKSKYETWRQMVKDKELSGVQLYFKGDESFPSAYQVQGIPRFILIDPQGNIVAADAPRPSDPNLVKLFNDLKI